MLVVYILNRGYDSKSLSANPCPHPLRSKRLVTSLALRVGGLSKDYRRWRINFLGESNLWISVLPFTINNWKMMKLHILHKSDAIKHKLRHRHRHDTDTSTSIIVWEKMLCRCQTWYISDTRRRLIRRVYLLHRLDVRRKRHIMHIIHDLSICQPVRYWSYIEPCMFKDTFTRIWYHRSNLFIIIYCFQGKSFVW